MSNYLITNHGETSITSLIFNFITPLNIELHADFSSIKEGEEDNFTGNNYTITDLNILPSDSISFSLNYTNLSAPYGTLIRGSFTVTGISTSGSSVVESKIETYSLYADSPSIPALPEYTENDMVCLHYVDQWRGYYAVTLPFQDDNLNLTVDWGDGTIENYNGAYSASGNLIWHQYPEQTAWYYIKITGNAKAYGVFGIYYGETIVAMISWGNLGLLSLEGAFFDGANLLSVPSNIPSTVTNVNSMFFRCEVFNDPNISSWDVSNITDTGIMFYRCGKFNQPLNNWDVSNVINMYNMFDYCYIFNQSLNNWDVSNVVDMSYMFYAAESFNQPLNNWDVSNVVYMFGMFSDCYEFNQSLNNWDVSNVVDMYFMFYAAESFNQPLNNWDVSNVVDMSGMFVECHEFNQPLNNWNVSNVQYIAGIFYECHAFNQPLNNWNVSNVVEMSSTFEGARSFNYSLNNWDVSNVQYMNYMFYDARSFNQPLNNWNVSNVFEMYEMFYYASEFNQDLSGWCVTLIPSRPIRFSSGSALTFENEPIWGTCPSGIILV